MIVAGDGVAAEEVVVGQKIARELAIAPLMVELHGIPKRDERKNVELFRRFEMQANNEVDVVLRELRMGRMEQAGERIHHQAFQVQNLGGNLETLDDLVFSRFLTGPEFDSGEPAAQHRL